MNKLRTAIKALGYVSDTNTRHLGESVSLTVDRLRVAFVCLPRVMDSYKRRRVARRDKRLRELIWEPIWYRPENLDAAIDEFKGHVANELLRQSAVAAKPIVLVRKRVPSAPAINPS